MLAISAKNSGETAMLQSCPIYRVIQPVSSQPSRFHREPKTTPLSDQDAQAAVKPETMTNIDLVRRCQSGDAQSFRYLYQRYQQRVRATLYQLCGAALIDDLVQEVFLRVWKGLPKLKQAGTFSTWLYRITWNVATDQRRAFVQRNNFASKLKEAAKLEEDAPKAFLTPDLMRLHYQDLVQRGLLELSLDHRTVLVLHDLEDLPQKEVAEILGIPVGTVKSRLFHARAAMRKFLEAQGVQL